MAENKERDSGFESNLEEQSFTKESNTDQNTEAFVIPNTTENTNADLSHSEFHPEASSTMKEPTPDKGETQTSSIEKIKKPTDLNITDVSYSDFTPTHHSSIDENPKEVYLSTSEIKQIVQETEDILDQCLKKVMNQEKVFIAMVYRVYHMHSDVEAYRTLIDQQSRFVAHFNPTCQRYLSQLSRTLPRYGDFVQAVQQTTDESPAGLSKKEAEELSWNVRDNSYNGGLSLKAQSEAVRDVAFWTEEKLAVVQGFETKQPLRVEVIEKAMSQLKKLVDSIVQVKAQLHCFMMGEAHRPVADYSGLF